MPPRAALRVAGLEGAGEIGPRHQPLPGALGREGTGGDGVQPHPAPADSTASERVMARTPAFATADGRT